MKVNLLQETYTPLTHAPAGRTPPGPLHRGHGGVLENVKGRGLAARAEG
jgi:hypothetical protein